MYAWIWGHLPGPTAVRVVICVVAILAVVALLFLVVFPWVTTLLPFTDTTVDAVEALSRNGFTST